MTSAQPTHMPVLTLDFHPGAVQAALFRSLDGAPEVLYSTVLPLHAEKDGALTVLSRTFWQKQLVDAGQPAPGDILAAVHPLPEDADDLQAREAYFRKLIIDAPGGVELRALGPCTTFSGLPRLEEIQRVSGFRLADALCASWLYVLGQQAVLARRFREGIALAHFEHGRAYLALVFQDRLLAVAEADRKAWNGPEAFLEDLDSFRLGWLPAEKARSLSGFSVSCPELPAEAEGFRPLYLSGPEQSWLRKQGISVTGEGALGYIFPGLLYGYSLQEQ